jgi:hypothetical protein
MGDAKTWLIFLLALLAVTVFSMGLLAAACTALVLLLKHGSTSATPNAAKNAIADRSADMKRPNATATRSRAASTMVLYSVFLFTIAFAAVGAVSAHLGIPLVRGIPPFVVALACGCAGMMFSVLVVGAWLAVRRLFSRDG